MYARILIPIDGRACSDHATAHAVALARAVASRLFFLFVMDATSIWHEGALDEIVESLTAQGRAAIARAEKVAFDAGVRAESELVEGDPADVIVRHAPDFDLVLMGSYGDGFWKRLTFGSVTQTVLHRIATPMLVVPCP